MVNENEWDVIFYLSNYNNITSYVDSLISDISTINYSSSFISSNIRNNIINNVENFLLINMIKDYIIEKNISKDKLNVNELDSNYSKTINKLVIMGINNISVSITDSPSIYIRIPNYNTFNINLELYQGNDDGVEAIYTIYLNNSVFSSDYGKLEQVLDNLQYAINCNSEIKLKETHHIDFLPNRDYSTSLCYI